MQYSQQKKILKKSTSISKNLTSQKELSKKWTSIALYTSPVIVYQVQHYMFTHKHT